MIKCCHRCESILRALPSVERRLTGTYCGVSMGLETNAESIRVLEREIEDGNGDIIKLKRARNSLLNISMRVPPEILGDIFSWILVRPDPDPDSELHFNRLPEGCYNFLLVCHHWFQVASHIPKLWTYCGNTLQDWEKWHHLHPRVTPLDLVLSHTSPPTTQPFIEPALGDALRDRATQDAVRQVHLLCNYGYLLSLVTSLLTPEGEGVQYRSIESIGGLLDLLPLPSPFRSRALHFFPPLCQPAILHLSPPRHPNRLTDDSPGLSATPMRTDRSSRPRPDPKNV